MLQTGSILLVQAITLMANYLQKRNKPNSGYNYLGLARRVAMGIGLHKELNVQEGSGGGGFLGGAMLRLEEKRRTWWCLFVFDAGATITFSRPMDFPSGGIEVDLPLNVNDCVRTQYLSQRCLLRLSRISLLRLFILRHRMKRLCTLT